MGKSRHSQGPRPVSMAVKLSWEGECRHAGSHLSLGEQAELGLIPLASLGKFPGLQQSSFWESFTPEQFSINSC